MPSSLNGTGVTFSDGTTLQSGSIPAANLGSGTANNTTFLRGDRTWQTASTTPTNAQILGAISTSQFGGLGTYCRTQSFGGTVGLNSTVSGSSLPFVNGSGDQYTGAVGGTWRNFGDREYPGAVFWLRIA